MSLHCKKCLTSRNEDVLGARCTTMGCDGIIERQPEFKELVDELPETFLCPRRGESFVASRLAPESDHWDKFKSNGDRVCSYCGSLHWEDMLRLVHEAAVAPDDAEYNTVPSIERTDKGYKVYVHRKEVRNAHEGGIKFYMQHVPRGEDGKIAVTEEQNAEYGKAIRNSTVRFERMLKARYPIGDKQ